MHPPLRLAYRKMEAHVAPCWASGRGVSTQLHQMHKNCLQSLLQIYLSGCSRLGSKGQARRRGRQQVMKHHVHNTKNPEFYHRSRVVHDQMSDVVRWPYEKIDSNVSEQNKSRGCKIRQDKVKREGQTYIGLVGLMWWRRNLVNQQWRHGWSSTVW